jgi:hypothetical protein
MRWNDFSRSLLFAAVAAAGFAPFAMLTTPWLSVSWALALYALACGPLYLSGLGSSRRRGVRSALLAAVLGGVALLVAGSPREAIVLAAVIAGLVRSGVVYHRPLARAALIEAGLLGVGLGVAQLLIASSTLSIVLAIWGFFLVQSVFFLVGGARRERSTRGGDAFERAVDQVNAILRDASV